MHASLASLPAFDDDQNLQVVVESPRGSKIKFDFDAERLLFTVSRSLPLGTTYPFDWGFIPGTRGQDGDPVDALAIHDSSTFPGVVLPCRVLGMVLLSQKGKDGRRQANHRVIATPSWNDRLRSIDEVRKLDKHMRDELEQFFLTATFFTGKAARVDGWADRKAALQFIERSTVVDA